MTAEVAVATGVAADLTEEAGRSEVAEAVQGLGGRLRVLVNNAGITRDALLTQMDAAACSAGLRVNLGAAYELTRRLLPLIVEGGAVVNLSSRSYLGNVGQFSYAASKGGLVGMTRALARGAGRGRRGRRLARGPGVLLCHRSGGGRLRRSQPMSGAGR